MDALERKINTPEYKNWIKGTLAIIHICEAVRVYTKYVFEQFKQNLTDGNHFDAGFNANYMCRNTEWQESGRKWTFTRSCQPCTILFNETVRLHLKKDRSMGFENGRIKQVPGCWGIAKLFMPKHCEDIETPEDTDPYALFHMILNCGLFPLTHQLVDSVITARNDMMHSKTNTLSDQDTRTYINAMKDFLQEASSKVTGTSCSTVRDDLDKARREIDGLLNAEMNIDILSEKAKKALSFKKDYIANSVRVMSSSGGHEQELKEYLDILEKLGGELQFWNRHPWEIRQVSELNDIRDQLAAANREKQRLNQDLEKAQNDLQDLQKKNIEMTRFQKELGEIQGQLGQVSSENQKSKADLTNIQCELNTSKKEKERFQEQLDAVRKHVTEVDKEQQTITSELTSVNEGINITKQENKSMQEQLIYIREQINDVNGENKNINNKISEANKELSIVKDESKRFHEDLDDVRKKAEDPMYPTGDENQTEDSKMQDDQETTQNKNNKFEENRVTEQEQPMVTDQKYTAHLNLQEHVDINNSREQLETGKADQQSIEIERLEVDKEINEKQVSEGQSNTDNNTVIDENLNMQDSGK